MTPLIVFVLLTVNHGHHPEVSINSAYLTRQECQKALEEYNDTGHAICVAYKIKDRPRDLIGPKGTNP
jgi:hypothetical protein